MERLERALREFEHTFNPQHFYCRLRDLDIEKEEAIRISKIYEIGIYQNILLYSMGGENHNGKKKKTI